MDLREIIKWFIPCFHILLKLNGIMIILCLLLFCNICTAKSFSELDNISFSNDTKNVVKFEENNLKFNQSEVFGDKLGDGEPRSNKDISVGRTFGRPMKKMMQALIPLAMAIGSAGTWAVVAALIGAKTLIVTLFILKLLLMAGAAKVGGLLSAKHGHGPPRKEVHVHIHNGHGHEEVVPDVTSWSRDSAVVSTADPRPAGVNPYQFLSGPETISTPYGHYVKVEPSTALNTHVANYK